MHIGVLELKKTSSKKTFPKRVGIGNNCRLDISMNLIEKFYDPFIEVTEV